MDRWFILPSFECHFGSSYLNVDNLQIQAGPTSVLILEDQEETLTWLRDIVSETFPAANVTITRTLKEAQSQASDSSFDLVLVDLGLPDGSGLELIKDICARSAEAYIVVATIYDDDDHLVAALKAGANGYLLKDEHRDQLIEHLKGIPASRTPLPLSARKILPPSLSVPVMQTAMHYGSRRSRIWQPVTMLWPYPCCSSWPLTSRTAILTAKVKMAR